MCFAEHSIFSMVVIAKLEPHKNHLMPLTSETDFKAGNGPI